MLAVRLDSRPAPPHSEHFASPPSETLLCRGRSHRGAAKAARRSLAPRVGLRCGQRGVCLRSKKNVLAALSLVHHRRSRATARWQSSHVHRQARLTSKAVADPASCRRAALVRQRVRGVVEEAALRRRRLSSRRRLSASPPLWLPLQWRSRSGGSRSTRFPALLRWPTVPSSVCICCLTGSRCAARHCHQRGLRCAGGGRTDASCGRTQRKAMWRIRRCPLFSAVRQRTRAALGASEQCTLERMPALHRVRRARRCQGG